MDPAPLKLAHLDVPALLRAHGLRPKKGLGQNFLIDETALRQITVSAEIPVDGPVLEIGPGVGSLTRYLAVAARLVTAVELDPALFPILQQVLAGFSNVRLVQGDILKIDPASLVNEPGYLVVANIPYYITSAVIRHLLGAAVRPQRIVLTVQKEVAQRICAMPGELSLLALSVQVFGSPRLVGRILAGAFYPAPEVDSAVVRIDLYDRPLVPEALLEAFFKLARAAFGQKRKTLRNSISGGLGWTAAQAATLLEQANIDPQRRAETVSMPEWEHLVRAYESFHPDIQ